MCGINGIVEFHQKIERQRRHSLVHKMNERIKYRGPDAEGAYDDADISLGMRRLSIVDPSGGRQPIFNEDKSVVVVLNGEIYNYKSLREELIQKNHVFITNSDTEIIVHGYEEYGDDILTRMDGMFAIALYDIKNKVLLLARDRAGEKPLYYYQDHDRLIFASEIGSIKETGLVDLEINAVALNQFLQLTYIPAPLGIYEGIHKICPGYCIRINIRTGQQDCTQFWSAADSIRRQYSGSYEDAVRDLYDRLDEAVKERVAGEVPAGAFLSGGIDSAIMVGLMKKNSGKPIHTFTVGFHEREYDERKRARQIAKQNGTIHHEYTMEYRDASACIDSMIDELGEPFADPSMIPTFYISKKAGKHVKVILTGDAGDELFLGYSKYLIGYYSLLYQRIPSIIRTALIERAIKKLPDTSKVTRKINKVIHNINKDVYAQREELLCLGFKKEELHLLLTGDYERPESLDFVRKIYDQNRDCDELSKAQCVDFTVLLEGGMLTKVDRMGMRNSIETRTPMLAKKVAELALSLPSEFKLSGKTTKKILKDTFQDILPIGFTKLPKSGFEIPMDRWFRTELKQELLQLLNCEWIRRQGIFQYEYVHKIAEEHFSGSRNRGRELWALYVFQKWYLNNLNGNGQGHGHSG